MSLPYDIARCNGHPIQQCHDCQHDDAIVTARTVDQLNAVLAVIAAQRSKNT